MKLIRDEEVKQRELRKSGGKPHKESRFRRAFRRK